MAGDRTVPWERCSHDGCVGVQLAAAAWCLAHVAEQDPSALDAELERIGDEGTIDARGVQLSAELLKRILRAAPQENDHPIFKGEAQFDGATFERDAQFDRATFKGHAGFFEATFKGHARFYGATFEGTVGFDRATFERDAGFDGATFKGAARFGRATFKRDAGFDRTAFKDSAGFDRATFEQAREIGPLLAKQLVLDEAVFHERVQLDVAAAALSAQRAQFPAGVQFRLRWASVVLDDANLAAPAILAGVAEPFPELGDDEQNALRGRALPPGPLAQQGRPQLVSLCRADVAGLRVANVDLRPCRFVGAHNLDRLRIEGEPLFARAPGWWRTRRKTLAEEQHWRAGRSGR
jgi:uncharacterized protein YjbI with pentapeptide repeats